MGAGTWIFLAVFAGYIAFLIALATGKASLGVVRDDRDALHGRWLVGASAVGLGGVIALDLRSIPALLVGVGLAVRGVAVIATARRRAPLDPTNRVPDLDVQRAAREFVFDSRPLARGPIELFVKRRWNAFVAVAAVGFMALLVGLAVSTVSEPSNRPAMIAFLVVMSAFFLLVVIGPSVWWLQRAIRGIPMVRIDSYGITMGRDRMRDLSMAWDDMQSVEVRVLESNGMRDRLLIVNPLRTDWLAEQPWLWRLYARLSRVMYGGHFALSTMALTAPLEEILARVGAFRPSLVSADVSGTATGAGFQSSSG